jgi:hypothetical protein
MSAPASTLMPAESETVPKTWPGFSLEVNDLKLLKEEYK